MKETKLATLTKEEIKELKSVRKMRGDVENMLARYNSAHFAYWQKLGIEHNLSPLHHYIKDNSIYVMEVE